VHPCGCPCNVGAEEWARRSLLCPGTAARAGAGGGGQPLLMQEGSLFTQTFSG